MLTSVSVVIPVHDRQALLVEAVRSALTQDPPPLEVLVVDDGSRRDPTARLLPLGHSVRVVRQEALGRSAARNRGAREARGEILAFLDSDDWWCPGKLARQLAKMGAGPTVGLIAGFVWVVDHAGRHQPRATARFRRTLDATAAAGFSLDRLIRAPGIFTSTIVVRRDVFEDIGGFDELLHAQEDWDLLLRIRERHQFDTVPWPPVAAYRIHSGNTGSEAMARSAVSVADRFLTRPAAADPKVRVSLLVRRAIGERTSLQQARARRSALQALRVAPGAALVRGAGRLLIGALLPQRLAAWVSAVRRSRFRVAPPERIDPATESRGVVAHHLARYIFARQITEGTRVLDVACGVGYGTQSLAAPGRLVVGVDIAQDAVTTAARRYKSAGVAFAQMDAESLACSPGTFDAVVCFEGIEHFRNPERHIREVARVLKPAGIFVLSTPRPGTGGNPSINPHHLHEFTDNDLVALLRPCFASISLRGQRRRQTWLHALAQRLDVLGLRRRKLLRPLARKVSQVLGTEPVETARVGDFVIDEAGTSTGSEFIVICRKREAH